MDVEKLVSHIKWAEGTGPYDPESDVYKMYQDSVGKWTIGVGHNIEDRGLDGDVVEHQLRNDIRHAISECRKLDYWNGLDPVRQLVVADLVFNMGMPTWQKFVNTNAALRIGDYKLAATGIENSRYYKQTGRRARRNVQLLRSGTWEDPE